MQFPPRVALLHDPGPKITVAFFEDFVLFIPERFNEV